MCARAMARMIDLTGFFLPQPDGKALFDAVVAKDVALVLELLRHGVEVNWRDRDYQTPLGAACCFGNYEMAEALCEHGAYLNTSCSCGVTPLMYAANANPKIVAMLLARGADPNLKSREGKTALHWGRNQPECVALLQPVTL